MATHKRNNGHRKPPARPESELDDADLWLLATRESKRKTKLSQQQEKATSKSQAVALTGDPETTPEHLRFPDMRFAEDKMLFSPDPSKRSTDGKPDRRYLDNRPDLREVHKQRGEGRKNFIFTDDMRPATK